MATVRIVVEEDGVNVPSVVDALKGTGEIPSVVVEPARNNPKTSIAELRSQLSNSNAGITSTSVGTRPSDMAYYPTSEQSQ